MRTNVPPSLRLLALVLALISTVAQNGGAAGYADAVLADGPIAYWRFNDAPPTAVNSGSLGAAANGTYNGGATTGSQAPLPPAYLGFETSNTALQCDGTDDFVGTATSLMNGLTSFTISGWMRRNANQLNRTGLWGQNDIVEFGYIDNNTLQLWTDSGLNVTPNPFPNGEWAHIVCVADGSPGTAKLYTNGVLAVTRPHTLPGNTTFFFNIGGGGVFDGTGNFFNGQIDEVAVFNKALTDAQIAAHYAASKTPITPLPNFANVGGNPIGTASFDSSTSTLTIVGGGNDIWDMGDEFAYAYTKHTADFDVRVRVASLSPNGRWSKAGLMVRESLAEDSRMVFLRVTPPDVATTSGGNGANDTKLAYRTGFFASQTDADPGENDGRHEDPGVQNAPPYPNAWLRLVRTLDVFTAHISADGSTWTELATQDTAAGNWANGGGPFRKDEGWVNLRRVAQRPLWAC